jgi:hypothetical protein
MPVFLVNVMLESRTLLDTCKIICAPLFLLKLRQARQVTVQLGSFPHRLHNHQRPPRNSVWGFLQLSILWESPQLRDAIAAATPLAMHQGSTNIGRMVTNSLDTESGAELRLWLWGFLIAREIWTASMVVGSQGSRVKVWMIATQTWIVDISSDKYGSSKMPLPLGLPPTLPRAASIHSSLDQKRSCSDCFSVSTDDDPAQPATEISLTSTSWSSSPKPTFSQWHRHPKWACRR